MIINTFPLQAYENKWLREAESHTWISSVASSNRSYSFRKRPPLTVQLLLKSSFRLSLHSSTAWMGYDEIAAIHCSKKPRNIKQKTNSKVRVSKINNLCLITSRLLAVVSIRSLSKAEFMRSRKPLKGLKRQASVFYRGYTWRSGPRTLPRNSKTCF